MCRIDLMYKFIFALVTLLVLSSLAFVNKRPPVPLNPHIPKPVFAIRSVDTMKYSRDLAETKMDDQSFDAVIDRQVQAIAETGATHVAVATPYDEEFVPFLTRWVVAARGKGLHVWFRGNFAGWEEWFGYPSISRSEHAAKLGEFIKSHSILFEDGDIFTPCPECENGGPGDPRSTGDAEGFRKFLIDEREIAQSAFKEIERSVSVNVQSMNYDVASLIMDRETTAALGGIVGIDHYVEDPHQIARDVAAIAEKSGGKVYLAEYGAPIPDIHGKMSEADQAQWIRTSLEDLSHVKSLAGINYWVSVGGSTELWDSSGTPREGVKVLKEYFTLMR